MPTTKLRPAPASDRASLKDIFEEVNKAKARIKELEAGQEKAREKGWAIASTVEDAQANLTKLQADEQRRLANAWAKDDEVDVSPIPGAEYALAEARAEAVRIKRVADALASEIPKATSRLNDVNRAFYEELALVVVGSAEYEALCQAHTQAWRRLRTCREALRAAHAVLGGAAPQTLMDSAQRTEPLQRAVGYPVDDDLVESWARAMERLLSDPDAPLPPI